jgi:butyrate kinase
MAREDKILVINPGSTSTKIAVYTIDECIMTENIRHYLEDLLFYPTIISQYEFRKELIESTLEMNGIDINELTVIMGRGGLTYPLKSGVYEVDDRMVTHVRRGILGQHASNLGPVIADALAKSIPNAKAYIANPVVTDEMQPVARISGHPRFERRSIFHALNQKAVSRIYASSISKRYDELSLIVAHMGGGVSVGAHFQGRVIDVNNALDGEGPFSPERSGTLPAGQLIDACFCGNFEKEELQQMLVGEGGMVAYLQTNSMLEIMERIEQGDSNAAFYVDAFVYQVAKAIGEMATVLHGKVDAIILTGGIAFSKLLISKISERISFIAPITVIPGEDEMEAMAMNARLMLKGEIAAQKYPH